MSGSILNLLNYLTNSDIYSAKASQFKPNFVFIILVFISETLFLCYQQNLPEVLCFNIKQQKQGDLRLYSKTGSAQVFYCEF